MCKGVDLVSESCQLQGGQGHPAKERHGNTALRS